jgi:hypothetical protein
VKVWQVLISYDKGGWFLAAAILLIAYNALRYHLTRQVALLSEEESRTHYTPALDEYRELLLDHWVALALGCFAVLSFGIHGYDWLTVDVFVPRQVDTSNRIDQQAPGAVPTSPGPASQSTDGKSASGVHIARIPVTGRELCARGDWPRILFFPLPSRAVFVTVSAHKHAR